MKNIFYVFILLLFVTTANAQEYHFGIRGGLNFATINGPSEPGAQEEYSITNGFHFGLEILYSFNDYISLGSGLNYSQTGAKYKFRGHSYYIFFDDSKFVLENDNVKIDLVINNSYINIPLNLYIRPVPRFELKMGAYAGFMISPTASGKMSFGNKFNQILKYNYYSDKKEYYNPYEYNSRLRIKVIDEDGEETIKTTNKIAKAYYQYPEEDYKDESYYNVLDYGINAGLNYYVNSGLYLGANIQYGLADITNDKLDRSLVSFASDGDLYFNNDDHLIYRKDKDTNFNIQISIGFRF